MRLQVVVLSEYEGFPRQADLREGEQQPFIESFHKT
jgi:hypothetical protein